ncbi:MAG TPA: hypothetical protein VKI65_14565 [Gemmataceae bacterium]|nr:hypothetical protein [Gemmataceae bacterium]
MKMKRCWHYLYTASLGLALVGLAGCQTWVPDVGMTLPSGRYLQHRPQYIPHSPEFPLSRELATMEEQAGAAAAGAGGPVAPGGPMVPAGPAAPAAPPAPPPVP